jgi:hypothetical protein
VHLRTAAEVLQKCISEEGKLTNFHYSLEWPTQQAAHLEEPALFNVTLARFLALAEADRWPARDPASLPAGH